MPYEAPPTFTDGDVLSASNLNVISRDIEYFHGLISGVNFPFYALLGTDEVDKEDQAYYCWHAGSILSYKFNTVYNSLSGDTDSVVCFYVDWGDAATKPHLIYAGTTGILHEGTVNLYDPSSWPLYVGDWATSTVYSEDSSPNWGRADGDGEIVNVPGTGFFKCETGHTSGVFATDLAAGYWTAINNPTAGSAYWISLEMKWDTAIDGRDWVLHYFYETA